MDDQRLVEAFQNARAADSMRVPPIAAILARVEYAREMRKRRHFASAVTCGAALAGAAALCFIVFSPRPLPLPMSPAIAPLLTVGGLAALWALTPVRLQRSR